MLRLGNINSLKIIKFSNSDAYLDGYDNGLVILPASSVPNGFNVGDKIVVFINLNSDGTLIATTDIPEVMVGECAYLNVIDVNNIGAFLDWGATKDLLVPFDEQQKLMINGGCYVVYLYFDSRSNRIVATTKLDKYLSTPSSYFRKRQQVNLLIYGRSDLGYKAVVNGITVGLIFNSDVFRAIKYGQKLEGYIKNIREDNRLDLCLQLSDGQSLDKLSRRVLIFIQSEGGYSTLTDKSKPEDIYAKFGVSKSNYKKSLGKLYKKQLILITENQVILVK